MPRRRRNPKCRQCARPLPPDHTRDDLTSGTDVCNRCASVILATTYRTLPAARRWLETWREKLRTTLEVLGTDR